MVRVKITKTYKQNPTLFSKATKGDQLRFQKIREIIDEPFNKDFIEILMPGVMTPPASPPLKEFTPITLQDVEPLPYQCSECGTRFKDICNYCLVNKKPNVVTKRPGKYIK
ncbi:hypothetical protein ACFFRR_010589 [Megaselia abdita]